MNKHQIKFKFITHKFDYKLPLVGVDLVFLADRRCDLVICLSELAARISNINLASRVGATDLEKSSKLLRWYHDALREINAKTYMINNPGTYDKKAMTATEADLWIKASSRID